MPTYVYRCPDRHEFETVHKMSEDGPTTCEICNKSPVERVLFPVAVHFKGSGFYATDYGRGNQKREGGSEGSSSGDEKKSSESSKSDGSSSGSSEGSSSGSSEGSSGDSSKSSSDGSSDGKSKKKTAET